MVEHLLSPEWSTLLLLSHLMIATSLSENYCFFRISHVRKWRFRDVKSPVQSYTSNPCLNLYFNPISQMPDIALELVWFLLSYGADSQSHGTFTVFVWQIWDEYLLSKCTSIQPRNVGPQLCFRPALCKDTMPWSKGGKRKTLNLVPNWGEFINASKLWRLERRTYG